jgi:hypothetical protein
MSLEMRNLMGSFEAQYDQPKPRGKDSSETAGSARSSQDYSR